MSKPNIDISVQSDTPETQCCECKANLDAAAGPCKPEPGDFTLCAYCGSLNVFTDNLALRPPTDEELLEAAKDSEIQAMRRITLRAIKERQ